VAIQAHPEIEAVNHVHHAGNSSGIVDGAAAVLVGSKKAGGGAGLKARARIKAFANIGSEPAMMLTGPIDVTRKVLKRAGMTTGDIDLFEINEAFASVVLRVMQALELDPHHVYEHGAHAVGRLAPDPQGPPRRGGVVLGDEEPHRIGADVDRGDSLALGAVAAGHAVAFASPRSSAWCLIDFPSTRKTTSSPMLVARSATRSRFRLTRKSSMPAPIMCGSSIM